MTGPDMIERVKLAIAANIHGADEDSVRYAAYAAVEAMREPTEAMISAAASNNLFGHPISTFIIRDWQSMIDAALSPPTPYETPAKRRGRCLR